MFSENDVRMIQNTLALARLGRFSISPSLRVGRVITHDNQIIEQGSHIRAGKPHTEVHTLRQAGEMAHGATVYIMLEPCSHYGCTLLCAGILIRSGVAHMVAVMIDPNPLVAGKDLAMLEVAGIHTESDLLETGACELNRDFLFRVEHDRPFVRIKCAASLDGKTTLSDGLNKWITGEAARGNVQILRTEGCIVITGAGTVLTDNLQLNVRVFPTVRQPVRVIVDNRLQALPDYRIIRDGGGPVLTVTLSQDANRLSAFSHFPYAEIIRPFEKGDRTDSADLPKILATKDCDEVMIEAGATLSSAFLIEDLTDELVLYQASKIPGCPGHNMSILPENPAALAESPCWKTRSVEALGGDTEWTLREATG